MKSAPDNSPLDSFIREKLKAPDMNLSPVDWSEVEVLLRPEKKSIAPEINKKTILIVAAGVTVIALAFGLFQVISRDSSQPAETETPAYSPSAFSVIDSVRPTVIDSIVVTPATARKDTTSLTATAPKSDSVPAAAAVPDTAVKKVKTPAPIAAKPVLKKEKKKKTDTASVKTDVPAPPAADTATSHPAPVQEIKPEPVPAADTANKNSAAPKNNSKKKKAKGKNPAPPAADTPKAAQPVEIKPDSLKQQ